MPMTSERATALEGTWEEVAEKAGDLAGKRVKIVIYTQDDGEAEEPETLAELLAGRIGGVSFEPRDPARNHCERRARVMSARQEAGRT